MSKRIGRRQDAGLDNLVMGHILTVAGIWLARPQLSHPGVAMMMLDLVKRLFGTVDGGSPAETGNDHSLMVAVCALFLEMGRIDETFSDSEMRRVISILTEKYGTPADQVDALLAEADRELAESVDLWQFARVINDNFSNARKEKLVERLWQVVFVDGRMDEHEHYLMNKLSHLLRLSHKQLIDAKLKVLHGS